MSLFSKKTTFILGSLVGSIVGLLFAQESGKDLREKLSGRKDPQEKFEALFREYLKVGKAALDEIKESELIQEIKKGGEEIIKELKKKAENEGGEAVKFAHRKVSEILQEVEKKVQAESRKTFKKVSHKIKKAAAKSINQSNRRTATQKKKPAKRKK